MQALRFSNVERSLQTKGQLKEFTNTVCKHFDMGHVEPVPMSENMKPDVKVYYFPMQAVRKEESTTSKVRVIFDASAKTTTAVSLNDTVLVGPTVYSPLIDMLL